MDICNHLWVRVEFHLKTALPVLLLCLLSLYWNGSYFSILSFWTNDNVRAVFAPEPLTYKLPIKILILLDRISVITALNLQKNIPLLPKKYKQVMAILLTRSYQIIAFVEHYYAEHYTTTTSQLLHRGKNNIQNVCFS